MATKCYLSATGHDDLPLLADSTVIWEQKKGVGPFQTVLHTIPDREQQVKKMAKGLVTLNIEPDMGNGQIGAAKAENKLKVEKLYILDYPAAQHPKFFAFVLADCRWMWEYFHIVSRYNVRRRIGFKRVEAPNEELADVKDDIWYKKFSLKDPDLGIKGKWTAQEALEDIISKVLDFEAEHDVYNAPQKRKYHLDRKLMDLLTEYPLDDMTVDDSGDQAINRMMTRLPMVNMHLKHNGDIQFYNALAGGDQEMVDTLGPEIFGTGHIDWVSKANVRPSKIHVMFTKEIEVRFDSQDEPEETVAASGSTVTGAMAPGEKSKIHLLENVLPVPDYKLKVEVKPDIPVAVQQFETLPNGSWISFHQALNAWANVDNLDQEGIENDAAKGIWPFLPKEQEMVDDGNGNQIAAIKFDADGNPIGTKLDFGFIRKGMIPWQDLWSGIVAAGERFPSALHSARLLAIPMHWRLTYRIPNDWIDGCLQIKNYRVGVVDQETGTRSPSMVYANYTIANTMRNMFKGLDALSNEGMMNSHGNAPSVYWTIYGYPNDLTQYEGGAEDSFIIHPDFPNHKMGVIDPKTRTGPATLMIIDHDQGIVRVDWRTDPLKLMDVVIPGHIDNQDQNLADENINERVLNEENHELGQDVKTWAARGGVPRGWNWVDAEKLRVTRMTRENRMATILTMIPAAPNDIRQLHKVTVKPKDIKDMLPPVAQKGLDEANGPEMYVRVGPTTTTARYAWKDTPHHAQIARNNFGIDQPKVNKNGEDEIEFEFKDDTLINKANLGADEFVIPGGGGANALRGPAVDEIALAYAAKIYASFADKLSGTVDGALNSNVEVTGYIGSVAHTIDPKGAAYTSLALAEPIPAIDIFSILDDGTRNLIMQIPTVD